MLHLIPLITTVLGAGLVLAAAVTLRRSAVLRPLLVVAPFVTLGSSHLAYAVIDGDSDVRDFYGSVCGRRSAPHGRGAYDRTATCAKRWRATFC